MAVGFSVDTLLEQEAFGDKRDANWCQLVWAPGVPLVLISLLPTYRASVRVASFLTFLFCLAGTVNALFALISVAIKVFWQPTPVRLDHLSTAAWSFYCFGGMAGIVATSRSLHINRACCFTTPPRLALSFMWISFRIAAFMFAASVSVGNIVHTLVLQPSCVHIEATNNSTTISYSNMCSDLNEQPTTACACVVALNWLALAILPTARNRGEIIALLGKGLAGESSLAAATIASMLPHGNSPDVTIRLAAQKFRALPFSALSVDHLATSMDTGLSEKTFKAPIGEVTAFMSHSWRDPAEGKWATLSHWVNRHDTSNGTHVTLWLDKACIDQSNIEESLQCLPVYLAFCHGLLVLAGPSYASRLWCIMELYTFLIVQSNLDGLEMFAFDDEGPITKDHLTHRFSSFDAGSASCFLQADRHQLLAVIESGYGSLSTFNQKVYCIVQRAAFRTSFAHIEPVNATGAEDVATMTRADDKAPEPAPPRAVCVPSPCSS